MSLRFTWNAAKAEANRRKHRVSFEEALTVFGDPQARIHDDPSHSEYEAREIMVGHSNRERMLLVSFTERNEVIRIIHARRATRHEIKDYEESGNL